MFIRELAAGYRRIGVKAQGVLLAVSGGADSTALMIGSAELANELQLRLEVATLDHALRPPSALEAAEVARRAARLGLECHVRRLELGGGGGVEARARVARYAALEELRASRGLDVIATAHTATDQAETVLMRLMRGSATRGAAGVLARRGAVVRPMLGHTREQVLAFLEARGEPFTQDPMNADPSFLRSRVRHSVLPALVAAGGPHVIGRLASFAQLAAKDEELLEDLAVQALARLRLAGGGFELVGLRALLPALRTRVVAALLRQAGAPVDSEHVLAAEAAIQAGTHLDVRSGLALRCEGGVVRLVQAPRAEVADGRALGVGETAEHGPWLLSLTREPPDRGLAFALGARVPLPLCVRSRQPGDRVRTARGTRKVQDLLVDAKVPRERRHEVPVVVDGEGVIRWVVGVWPRRPPSGQGGWYLSAWRSGLPGERPGGR